MSVTSILSFFARFQALFACAMAANLAVARETQADDASAATPVPVQIISLEFQDQPAPAEPVATPPIQGPLPQRDEQQLIARVLGRSQPQDSQARQLDAGETFGHGPGTTRPWGPSVSAWEAPAFCHRPLYFEDENIERHGRSLGLLQPAASTVHFAGRTLAWPYLAGAYPPHECIYTLGRERPGSCAAYRVYRPPLSIRGAVYESAAAAGLSFLVP